MMLLTCVFVVHGQETSIKENLDRMAIQYMSDLLKIKADKNPVYNVQMSFLYKDDYTFHGAVGQVSKKDDTVPEDYKFKIASVTKTFTAVIVMQLMEEGVIKLSDPLVKHIDESWVNDLSIIKKRGYGDQITIHQLLGHTSGLADYVTDDWQFMARQLLNVKKSWTPQLVLDHYFKRRLHKRSVGRPGSRYHYSDTNYLLLGMLIERLEGKSLASSYQERIIQPLGLNSTYMDPHNNYARGMMHQYRNKKNVTTGMNVSFDWGAGGLVSTTRDLSAFIKGLFSGKLFKSEQTLLMMTGCVLNAATNDCYALGIERSLIPRSMFEKGAMDKTLMIGHQGYWGVYMYYFPQEDVVAVISIGQVYHDDAQEPWVRLMRECNQIFNSD